MPDYTTRVGNVEIVALSDGSIRFAPSDFFPTIPEEAWAPYSDDLTPEGDMIMNLGSFLLRSEGKTLLIDTGLGIDTGHLDTLDMGKLLTDMQAKGISRDEVDIVAITHLHIDHVGWNFLYDDDGTDTQQAGSSPASEVERSGEPRPTFANARYWVSNADWRVFTRGALRKRPYIPAQVLPLEEQGILELFEGEQAITSEITTLPTPGHTPGHTSFLISSQGEHAIITGDAIHARAQAQETHWSPRADSKPDVSAESRHSLLDRIERDNAMLISGHFPARLRHARPRRRPPLLAGVVGVRIRMLAGCHVGHPPGRSIASGRLSAASTASERELSGDTMSPDGDCGKSSPLKLTRRPLVCFVLKRTKRPTTERCRVSPLSP